MKQTAVEWLMPKILELTLQLSLRKISARNCELEIANLFEQAKEMEKEQIMSAFTQGDIFGADYYDGVNITEENYYNKTFKSE